MPCQFYAGYYRKVMGAVKAVNGDRALVSFLKERGIRQSSIKRLQGDASTRTYFRVYGQDSTWILCHDPLLVNTGVDDYPQRIVYTLLKGRVPIPEIYTFDAERGLVLQQDLGDELLADHLPGTDDTEKVHIYRACLNELIEIQTTIGGTELPFRLRFDVDKLMFEFEFFIEHFLCGYWGIQQDDRGLVSLRNEFFAVAALLYRPDDFVLAHRDFHARNIMLYNKRPWIIDYQDARMGLPLYDLVSLLRDPYFVLSDDLLNELTLFYCKAAQEAGVSTIGSDEFQYHFDIMAFQRNIKALGTFGYQSTIRGNHSYEKYIQPAISYLPACAARTSELKSAWGILKEYSVGHTKQN